MAQTTGGMSASGLITEYSTNGTSYTALSGHATAIETGGGERAYAEKHTFETDFPIVSYGKMSAAEILIRGVYTQTDAEFFDILYDALLNETPLWIKYSIPGGTTGDKSYTVKGQVVMCTPPGGDADSADLVLAEARLVGAKFTEAIES